MAVHDSHRHAASLLVPTRETRRDRRVRVKAERALVTERERALADAARRRRADERAALRDAPAVPRAGERRTAAGRNWRRLRVQAHRATSATLAAAYPFLAEAGLGGAGMLIGTDAYSRRSFVYDPWVLYQRAVLTNPNLAVAGEIGAGKSALLKSLVARSLCFGRRAYVPGDPKGEWTPLTRAVGGTALELGPGMPTRINPLDAGTRPAGLDESEWRRDVRARRLALLTSLAETLMGRPLHPVEHTATAAALDTAAGDGEPVLPQVVHTMLDPNTAAELPPGVTSRDRLAEDGREAAHALARLVFGDLAGLFDQASTARFDPHAPMISIDVSRIGEDNALIPLVMACTSAWMEAALRDPAGGHRWMVYDEAWKLMRNPALVRRMETQWRLSRAWGLANVLAVHQLADFDAVGDSGSEARARATALLALTSTRVIYRQPADQLSTTASAMGLNSTETGLLTTLPRGRALWRVGTRAFAVDHLLTDRELAMFDTDSRMIEKSEA
ncbi:MAG: ATP-binding protein [bacterium]